MTTKHTPGNWKAYDWDIEKARTLRGVGIECGDGFMQGGFEVAVAHGHTSEEAFANAKLISCAPAMLDTLIKVLKVIEDSDYWWIDSPNKGGFDREEIENVIKKATE